jgi:uncharacterized protein
MSSNAFSPPPPPNTGVADPTAPIAQQARDTRGAYMNRVYMTLLLGITAFIGMQYLLFWSGAAAAIFGIVAQTNWLLILGGFMVVSWLATRMTSTATTAGRAWGGYLLLIGANALLFAAPLYLASQMEAATNPIVVAGWLSILAFGGLSAIAMLTGKDFSFLRPFLMWGGVLALCLIVGSVLFGTGLGTWFAVAMIGVAGAAILYDTQKIYKSFPPGTEVVAAMHLFSSLALLFWYVLQLVMNR